MKDKNTPLIRTIRYLGNKRRVLNEIHQIISENIEKGGIILDIFSGTNCVGYSLKKDYVVYSNDIQSYSYVIAKAIIENNKLTIDKEQAKKDLLRNYTKNYDRLSEYFKEELNKEDTFFSEDFIYAEYEKYRIYCENFPYYDSGKVHEYNSMFLSLFSEETIDRYRKKKIKFPYILFSTYFINGYFGIRQCLQIDSLRYAIDQIKEKDSETKKMIYLTALVYAINLCVTSTGHFAQFRAINSEGSCKEVIKERKKDIEKLFYDLIDELFSNTPYGSNKNKSFNEDYLELLDKKSSFYPIIKNVDLVYADPPYTSDHYSRFYHVLETLIKYDYPCSIGKGRYRQDRYNSNFSMSKNVETEFEKLISSVNDISTKLLLSYTNVGLVSLRRLKKICSKYYRDVTHRTIYYNHSNQGRKTFECNNGKSKRKEYLIYCE